MISFFDLIEWRDFQPCVALRRPAFRRPSARPPSCALIALIALLVDQPQAIDYLARIVGCLTAVPSSVHAPMVESFHLTFRTLHFHSARKREQKTIDYVTVAMSN